MIKAEFKDKQLIIDILSKSFDDNKSVNYIIKQDAHRVQRIARLMDYSFEICYRFGKVVLSDDKKACALILLPDMKKTSLASILLDVKLAISCIGITNLRKAMDREAKIKKMHPSPPFYYLWFIGVTPDHQAKGIGSNLLKDILIDSDQRHRPVYLETSTLRNLPWYERYGFRIYSELDLGYKLYFLKKE